MKNLKYQINQVKILHSYFNIHKLTFYGSLGFNLITLLKYSLLRSLDQNSICCYLIFYPMFDIHIETQH